MKDIEEMLALPLIGVIPESPQVLNSSNMGQPVIATKGDRAAIAFEDTVARFLGEEREMKFLTPEEPAVRIFRFLCKVYSIQWFDILNLLGFSESTVSKINVLKDLFDRDKQFNGLLKAFNFVVLKRNF